jgi:hypothetical protein
MIMDCRFQVARITLKVVEDTSCYVQAALRRLASAKQPNNKMDSGK